MAELGRFLIYEASRDWLLTVSGEVNTPCGTAQVEFIDPREPVKVVPILRAGLVLVEHAGSVLPANQTYHVGNNNIPSIYCMRALKSLSMHSK
jgi:uracil phosphoribosyltransferase